MAFRFRRRAHLAPGLWLNFSKGGISASFGRRGATLNVSAKGTRTTAGVPGTGISYSSRRRPWSAAGSPVPQQPVGFLRTALNFIVGAAIVGLLIYLIA